MRKIFDAALPLLLKHEGGFVNNPTDPGGMTNLGVTKHQWEMFVGHPVTEAGMRALTPTAVAPFYKRAYWDSVRCDELPAGVDDCLFDCCVNSGPGRATKILQKILGLTQDGVVGAQTLAFVATWPASELISDYCAARLAFLKTLPTWPTFGTGWDARVKKVQIEATALAGAATPLVA